MLQADKKAKLADETGEELKKGTQVHKKEGLLLQIWSNEKKETNFQMLKTNWNKSQRAERKIPAKKALKKPSPSRPCCWSLNFFLN